MIADYIVAPRAAAGDAGTRALRDLLAGVDNDSVKIKSVSGPPGAPRHAVLAMTDDMAQKLQSRYARELIIEPDSTLQMS
jgi:hypothetical protein